MSALTVFVRRFWKPGSRRLLTGLFAATVATLYTYTTAAAGPSAGRSYAAQSGPVNNSIHIVDPAGFRQTDSERTPRHRAWYGMDRPRQRDVNVTYIGITPEVLVPNAKRLGINIGGRDPFGAGQILKNLLDNPGFEAGEYATLLHVDDGSTPNEVLQAFWDTSWNVDQWGIGQPEGFWDGGTFEFLYGPAKGRLGNIERFDHASNRYRFLLDGDGQSPNAWDVVSARVELTGISSWPAMRNEGVDTTTVRPGSPGTQSFRLTYQGQSWISSYEFYMDSFWRDGDRTAGKLFIVQGTWRFEFWAKGLTNASVLRVEFAREGEAAFIRETVPVTTEWQHYAIEVNVPEGTDSLGSYQDSDYHPLLAFKLFVNEGQDVWIDDMALFSTDDVNPTVFTDAFVDALKELNPGIIRDWSVQLGASLDNELAEPWARKTHGWRPHGRVASIYGFSLHEFLELCGEVGAEPWYVVPPTFSEPEMTGLIEYLAAPATSEHPYAQKRAALGRTAPWTDSFARIHLEFGNEMWGSAAGDDPFFGASALGGERLGQIADNRFYAMRAFGPYFDESKFNLIIGGQAGFPGRQPEIEANSSNHDTIALAPYFGGLDGGWSTDEQVYYPLFASPQIEANLGNMRASHDLVEAAGQGTNLAIYEINFHTTGGNAPLDVRNDYVTGMGGAIALPLHMLTYQRDLGIRDQCAFTTLQYAFRMWNGEHVKLWGLLRDVAATGRKRPTWLGMELANRIIQGDMVGTQHTGLDPSWTQAPTDDFPVPVTVKYLQSFAFRDGNRYGLLIFNLHLLERQRVRITLPSRPVGTVSEYRITAPSIHSDNEEGENVRITQSLLSNVRQAHYTILEPHSVYALSWTGRS